MPIPETTSDWIAVIGLTAFLVYMFFYYEGPCEKFEEFSDDYHQCQEHYAQEAEFSRYGY